MPCAVVVTNRLKYPSKAPRIQQVNPQKQTDVTKLRRIIGWRSGGDGMDGRQLLDSERTCGD